MNKKSLALGGAAIVALLFAAPAFSQTAPDQTPPPGTSSRGGGLYGSQVNPPQHSSPAEKRRTRELNEQAVDGTTQPPAVLNGEAPPAGAGPGTPANPPSDNPPPRD